MQPRHYALGVATAAALTLTAASAEAAFTIERFTGDDDFTSRSGTEYAVAEGRAGNQASNGDWEIGIGAPNTQPPDQQAQFDWNGDFDFDPFTLSYTATSNQLTFDVRDTSVSTSVDLSTGTNVFIRARGGATADEPGELSDLVFNSHDLGDLKPGVDEVRYLAFAGPDLATDWSLTGNVWMPNGDGSSPAFQIKLTDASVVPLPAAAWLMISGLAGVGYTAYRGRKAAAA
jgi:hypothetical protein